MSKSMDTLRALIVAELARLNAHIETPSTELIYGDLTEYKRGGREALEGVLRLIDKMMKAPK